MNFARLAVLGCWAAMAYAQQLEIVWARYGAGFNTIDVTDRVRSLVRDNTVTLTVDIPTLGSDPAPGTLKTLTVHYRLQGAESEVSARDSETLRVPAASSGGFSISDLFKDKLPITQQVPAVSTTAPALMIVSARYGAGDKWRDVRDRLQGLVSNGKLSATINNQTMGGDPAVGQDKRIEVRYQYNGQTFDVTANEDRTLSLPSAQAAAAAPAPAPVTVASSAPMAPVTIVSARYGSGDKWVDVRDRMQGQLRDNRLEVTVSNQTMGSDPAVGKNKSLQLRYEQGGQLYDINVTEGKTARVPDSSAVSAGAAPVTWTPVSQSGGLRIVSARYGAQNKFNDVRSRLESLIRDGRLQTAVNNQTMGGDPIMGKKKTLELQYEYQGQAFSISLEEDRTLDIPSAPAGAVASAPAPVVTPGTPVPGLGPAGGLRVFYARYGAGSTLVDVRERLRPLLQGDRLTVNVGAASMGGDPLPNQEKTLTVIYEWKGRTYEKSAVDGQTLSLP
ncbi:MAG: DUF3395 domain-containing protein [Bryobacteraceae bacterium]